MLATIRFRLLSSHLLSRNVKVKIHKTIILPVVLYGCETWSLILRQQHRLRVFENWVLRKMFGPKRDEEVGEWRKLHNGQFNNLYSSPDIIRQIKSRRMRWAGRVAHTGEGRNVYRVLVGKPEGKRPLERPKHRWADGIRLDLRETGYGGVPWIHLIEDSDQWWALVNAVMDLWVLVPQSQLTNSMATEPEGSSPQSQEPANGPYPQPGESTPHPPNRSPQDPF
jgi:hypothetical protein